MRSFVNFWCDLLVGDDWQITAGITVALLLTWQLAEHHLNAWWVIPLAVTLVLVRTLRRAARQASRRP
jgi:hypothetical protein